MQCAHDVEILLKEKYGTRPGERYYVKPPEQTNVVILDEGMSRNFLAWLPEHVLLPQGYPDSVSKDYTAYQIWDTAQAFCSTIMGTLATQEVLRGMGVGNESATPMAATITWVLKDGCGHIGRILFAYSRGTHLDAYSKKWRLYADVLNDAAMCIEMALPVFNYTTLSLCISSSMKAIVGVAGGATRIALTQHHALRNNLADVSAKDAAQETAVNLLASCFALMFINMLGHEITMFIVLMILHITFNYMAVRAVCLRTLNEPRYIQVINGYVRHELIPAPCTVNHNEPLFFYQMGVECLDYKICGFSIILGQSVKKHTKLDPNSLLFRDVIEVYRSRNYLLYPCIAKRHMFIMIRDHASVDDILRAYFHAVLLSAIICAINNISLGVYKYGNDRRPFAEVCRALQLADWTRENAEEPDVMGVGGCDFPFNPSPELLAFVDTMVHKEWNRFRAGLIAAGWDTTKHLLLMDEWRVVSHVVSPKRVSISDDIDIKSYTKDTMLATLGEVNKYVNKAEKRLGAKEKGPTEVENDVGEITERMDDALKELKEVPQELKTKILDAVQEEIQAVKKEDPKLPKERTLEEVEKDPRASKKSVQNPEENVLGPDGAADVTTNSDDTNKGNNTFTDVRNTEQSIEGTTASVDRKDGATIDTIAIEPQPSRHVGDLEKIFSREDLITNRKLQDPFNVMKTKEA